MTGLYTLLAEAGGRLGSSAEARTLMAHACGCSVSGLLTLHEVDPEQGELFLDLVSRRLSGVPVQYLTAEAHFRTVTLTVGPGVFVPRPETEVMTGWALERLSRLTREGAVPRVVELCAGSGAISAAIAAELPGCEQHAVEISAEAAAFAMVNLAGTGVRLVEGDMAVSFPELNGSVDLVIANPPYIPLDEYEGVALDVREHEPAVALFSGSDGLDALRVVSRVAARLLKPGGVVCAEHADSQGQSAVQVFLEDGAYSRVQDHRDLTERPRFVSAVRAGLLAG